jgi:hypothetical protein
MLTKHDRDRTSQLPVWKNKALAQDAGGDKKDAEKTKKLDEKMPIRRR